MAQHDNPAIAFEPHHVEGAAVRVVINQRGDTLPGVVTGGCEAFDRDYRVHVRGTGIADGKRWLECAPECVLPAVEAA